MKKYGILGLDATDSSDKLRSMILKLMRQPLPKVSEQQEGAIPPYFLDKIGLCQH
jgi:hypothetical protein